jgi:hypothetical protein
VRPVAVVAGYLARYPLGGHMLSQMHFLVGLQRLGYEVVFVEHFGWPNSCYNPRTGTMSDDPAFGIGEMRRVLDKIGVRRWCYIDATGSFHGLSRDELVACCRSAEFLLSIASTTWLDELRECRTRVFIDTDPGFCQFNMPPQPSPSCSGYASPYDFQFHFTTGERIGKPDCPIPTHGLQWRPARWPMAMDLLPLRHTPDAKCFTTVMSWSTRKPIVYDGVEYGQKDVEFAKIIGLPKRVGPVLEIALAGPNAPRERLAAAGWRIADPLQVTATPWSYIDYIGQSRGEFSVAVNLYVKSRSGWFSDRTAAYLASGKPVIVQDTGFNEFLPCGEGLFAFRTEDDAVAAVDAINTDYERHCRAARAIAEQYFDSDKLLGDLLRQCGLRVPAPQR